MAVSCRFLAVLVSALVSLAVRPAGAQTPSAPQPIFEHTTFKGGLAPARPAEDSCIFRCQLAF